MIANALKTASVFESTYVFKAFFSKMVRITNQYRNRLLMIISSSFCALHPSRLRPALINLSKVKVNVKFRIELVFILCLSFVVVVILQYMLGFCFVAISTCVVYMWLLTTLRFEISRTNNSQSLELKKIENHWSKLLSLAIL